MNVLILTPLRILGDSLAPCLIDRGLHVSGIARTTQELAALLDDQQVDVVLADVSQGIDEHMLRPVSDERPELVFVALGVREEHAEIVRCGRAGFAGYVSRDATVDAMCHSLREIVGGKLACPAEIAAGLLRALHHQDEPRARTTSAEPLTAREQDVLRLIGDGMTNKEIARHLGLSVATVKHHVHNVLDKLSVPRRAQAMRQVREMPWLADEGGKKERLA
jgi:DNA-binding NarL/FixJ family response regulator